MRTGTPTCIVYAVSGVAATHANLTCYIVMLGYTATAMQKPLPNNTTTKHV